MVVLVWGLLAAIMRMMGIDQSEISTWSQAALIPIWFLAIYIMVVVLAPATYRLWQRWGLLSFFALAALGALVDLAFFAGNIRWMGWSNYFWVWLSVHQLGYAWQSGRMPNASRLLIISGFGLTALTILVFAGPYPLAMVGSPDPGLSNTSPPKITLLALGVFQFGLLLAFERPMRRFLDRLSVWAATVLINSMIMTIYLWHLTAMMAVIAAAFFLGGFGLQTPTGSPNWWLLRPLWIMVLYMTLLPLALIMAPFERMTPAKGSPIPSAVRLIAGALLTCSGLSLIALYGFGGAPITGIGVGAFVLVFAGAAIGGQLPSLKRG